MADIVAAVEHISLMQRHLLIQDMYMVVTAVLLDMGFPSDRVGFDYLVDAIVIRFSNQTAMFTKYISPEVARLYGPSVDRKQVERGIGRIIADAWEYRDDAVWKYFFPTDRNGIVIRPTSSEFISRIARFLMLWKASEKEVEGGAHRYS